MKKRTVEEDINITIMAGGTRGRLNNTIIESKRKARKKTAIKRCIPNNLCKVVPKEKGLSKEESERS